MIIFWLLYYPVLFTSRNLRGNSVTELHGIPGDVEKYKGTLQFRKHDATPVWWSVELNAALYINVDPILSPIVYSNVSLYSLFPFF